MGACPCETDEATPSACGALSPHGALELELRDGVATVGTLCCTRAAGHEGDHVRCAIVEARAPTQHGAERWPQVR